jgi:hypothetical protein
MLASLQNGQVRNQELPEPQAPGPSQAADSPVAALLLLSSPSRRQHFQTLFVSRQSRQKEICLRLSRRSLILTQA